MVSFYELIHKLEAYWAQQGAVILQPYDSPMGAGTFHPETFLKSIGPEPWSCAHPQICRRPTDGRYGENPNRLGKYYQFQVLLKPSPENIQELYINSLKELGINPLEHDIRFVEDNWESPTLSAWGLGWEVWLNGMEITQFTYFQQVGGLRCKPVSGEVVYGLERLAMYLQDVDNVYDLVWMQKPDGQIITYGDIFLQAEIEESKYNFEIAPVDFLLRAFADAETNFAKVKDLPLVAYEEVLKASHYFNLLDARKAISVTERANFIARVRNMAKQVAETYYENREKLGFPLLTNRVK